MRAFKFTGKTAREISDTPRLHRRRCFRPPSSCCRPRANVSTAFPLDHPWHGRLRRLNVRFALGGDSLCIESRNPVQDDPSQRIRQNYQIKRLGNHGITASVSGGVLLPWKRVCRHRNDDDVLRARIRFDLASCFPAVHARHGQVHQHDVGSHATGGGNCVGTISGWPMSRCDDRTTVLIRQDPVIRPRPSFRTGRDADEASWVVQRLLRGLRVGPPAAVRDELTALPPKLRFPLTGRKEPYTVRLHRFQRAECAHSASIAISAERLGQPRREV